METFCHKPEWITKPFCLHLKRASGLRGVSGWWSRFAHESSRQSAGQEYCFCSFCRQKHRVGRLGWMGGRQRGNKTVNKLTNVKDTAQCLIGTPLCRAITYWAPSCVTYCIKCFICMLSLQQPYEAGVIMILTLWRSNRCQALYLVHYLCLILTTLLSCRYDYLHLQLKKVQRS